MRFVYKGMRICIILFCIASLTSYAYAQEYSTEDGHLLMISSAPLQHIEGNNNMLSCMIEANGEVNWSVRMDAFRFENADLETIFAEQLFEIDFFPYAEFMGGISEGVVDWEVEGIYDITLLGDVTFHGQTKIMEYPGLIQVLEGDAILTIQFVLNLSDYGIAIPIDMVDKIAEEVEFNLSAMLK